MSVRLITRISQVDTADK